MTLQHVDILFQIIARAFPVRAFPVLDTLNVVVAAQ